MAFQLSPGVLVTEKDLTSIVPAVATSIGAFAGAFQWGPVDQVTTVESENKLVEIFGKPNDTVFKSFFTAANFLAYGNNLQTIRSVDASAKNSTEILKLTIGSIAGLISTGTVDGGASGNSNSNVFVTFTAPLLPSGTTATAYATVSANLVTGYVLTDAGSGYNVAPTIRVTTLQGVDYANVTATPVVASTAIYIPNESTYLDQNANGNGYEYGGWASKYPGALGNSLKVSMADAGSYTGWTYANQFDSAPSTSTFVSNLGGSSDEVHVIVVDEEGAWTGTRGSILEKFPFMSKTPAATKSDGSSSYYKDIINQTSKYVWWLDHPVSAVVSANITLGNVIAWGAATANGKAFANVSNAITTSLAFGVSGDVPGNLVANSYAEFANDEKHDISLILAGDASTTVINSLVSIAETRRDCVVFASPQMADVVNTTGQAAKVVDTRNLLTSSSYGFMDSSWKYQYDRYNDKYRWVPMNGDVAGLAARTDYTNDPWFSPAGFNRGTIKNVVKLSYSPSKTDRDTLYKNGVNPVVSFPGQGTVLFGDKTMLSKPSAFDRINVRRLFIVLEKAIATAAKFQLFEFNDGFTRAQFKNLVEPFLRDVIGRRGITDFRVVCDETNNTGEVIDRNEFVADIFIKPARSINFIQLNFIATRTGISFEETGA